MRKLCLILLFLLPLISFGQETELGRFFEKYSGKEGYSSIYITKYMFDLFKKIETTEEDKEFQEAISNLTAIKILALSNSETKRSNTFRSELNSALPKSKYKELMIIKEADQTVTFWVREEGEKISEFVMTVDEKSDPVLILLEGDIDLNQVAKLSRSMKVSGFEHLEKIEDK